MNSKPTYLDFAIDESLYLNDAYSKGLRYNAMVSQAQRACECYLKHIISKSLCLDNSILLSHNLRSLYDYLESVGVGVDLKTARNDIMCLNNFYTHTRYPGKDAFMASSEDIDIAVKSLNNIVKSLKGLF